MLITFLLAHLNPGTYSFCKLQLFSTGQLYSLYVSLHRIKLEYAYISVFWNNLTLADANRLENTQKFCKLCYSRYFQPDFSRNYDMTMKSLNVRTLYTTQQYLDLFINVLKDRIVSHRHVYCLSSCAH
jgi:hypothetical protein